MKSALLVLVSLGLLALFAPAASAATTTLPAGADTYVRSDQPTTNFGTATQLSVDGQLVGNASEPERQSYLRFNSVPSGATSAVLRLRIEFPTSESYQVRSLACDTWTETGTTYNTRPALGAVLASPPHGVANTYQAIALPAPPSGSACYALAKTGTNWMTVSSRESAFDPELVVTVPDPTPTPTPTVTVTPTPTPPPPPPSQVARCTGTPVNVTPSTIQSTINARDNVVVIAAPGTYAGLSIYPSTPKTCVEIRCAVMAKVGDFASNPSGCRLTGQSDVGAVRNFTIEQFVFATSDDYGLAIYDESPYVGMKVRIAENAFNGNMLHDISTKERVAYAEVVDNYFISCQRHCWEIGQNGNIRTRPSTTGTSLFERNKVSSRINAITQRYNLKLDVIGNEFRSVAGYAVTSDPYWARYPFGQSGDNGDLYVPGTMAVSDPKVPLRTTVTGNSFSAGNRVWFKGRGVINDTVLVKSNTGPLACTRGSMPSDAAGAHINEETTAPPARDPTSDIPC